MKLTKVLALAVFATCFAAAASAQSSVVFSNSDGTFTYDEKVNDATYDELTLGEIGNGLGASGSLYAISGLSAFGITDQGISPTCYLSTSCLGTITIQTGTIASGSILSNAKFNPGGQFSVQYTGLGEGAVSFTGTFSKAKWTEVGASIWTFTGVIMNGQLTVNGNMYTIPTAATVQLTTVGDTATYHPTKKTYTFSDSQGTTNFSIAPEPATLTLFGTGLIAVGAFTRRRLTGKTPTAPTSL